MLFLNSRRLPERVYRPYWRPMELTVLGCYGPYPAAGGACSGYLLEEDGCRVLIDCGSGTLSRLQAVLSFKELDAMLVSHLHSDHMADLLIMRFTGTETAQPEGS